MFNPLKVRLMRSVCGLDVHKDSVYLCILSEDGELIEKVFGVLTFQLHQMRDLLLAHHVEKVSMESTSVYWIPIWRILAPHFHLQLVNPYFIKQLPGHKSDVADAQWIAECTMKNLISSSFVPPEDIQQLRQYDRRIFDLDEEIVRKLSKLDAVMQRCNIRLSNYVSNVDCKSYKDVVRKISEGVTDPEILIEEIHGRIIKHHGRETILASLTGVVSQAEVDVLRQLREELDLAEEHKQECLERMLEICQEKYPDELRRLQTIPGVKERTATSLIAEIGTDMSKFETANHLAAWSGLRPRNDESNKKFKSRRITHGNVYLRKNIIQEQDRTLARGLLHQSDFRKLQGKRGGALLSLGPVPAEIHPSPVRRDRGKGRFRIRRGE